MPELADAYRCDPGAGVPRCSRPAPPGSADLPVPATAVDDVWCRRPPRRCRHRPGGGSAQGIATDEWTAAQVERAADGFICNCSTAGTSTAPRSTRSPTGSAPPRTARRRRDHPRARPSPRVGRPRGGCATPTRSRSASGPCAPACAADAATRRGAAAGPPRSGRAAARRRRPRRVADHHPVRAGALATGRRTVDELRALRMVGRRPPRAPRVHDDVHPPHHAIGRVAWRTGRFPWCSPPPSHPSGIAASRCCARGRLEHRHVDGDGRRRHPRDHEHRQGGVDRRRRLCRLRTPGRARRRLGGAARLPCTGPAHCCSRRPPRRPCSLACWRSLRASAHQAPAS